MAPEEALVATRPMTVSASQLETAERCTRLWWFEKVVKLPQVAKENYFTFGEVLHGVVERWLRADANGRDAYGHGVDLYPVGWDALITSAEADLIARLVEKGIAEGVIERIPGARVEVEFEGELDPGIGITGRIDYLVGGDKPCVQDHKSTKSTYYIKSPAALAKSTQMLVYAKRLLDDYAEEGLPEPATIKLRHNVFVKDPEKPSVRRVEVEVTPAEIEQHHGRVIGLARRLQILRETNKDETKWASVRGPDSSTACRDYGGCKFQNICVGDITTALYREEVARLSRPQTTTTGGSDMTLGLGSLLEQKLAAKAALNAAVNGTAGSPPVTTTIVINPAPQAPVAAVTPIVTQTVSVLAGAPWAVKDCSACHGLGFNEAQSPCQICRSLVSQRGGITSDAYVVTVKNGLASWLPREGTTGLLPGALALTAPVEVKAEVRVETAPAKVKRTKKGLEAAPVASVETGTFMFAPPTPVAAPTPPPVVTKTDSAAAVHQLRPETQTAAGFTLMIDCDATGLLNTVDLSKLLINYGNELARAKGVQSYYALEPFKRCDALAQVAEKIAAEVGATPSMTFVMANGNTHDFNAFVEALRPYAVAIVRGVGR